MRKVLLAFIIPLLVSSVGAPPTIMFDESHNLFKIEKAFPHMVYILKSQGYEVDYADTLDLSADVLVLMAPSDEFTRVQRKQITDYVKNGGGLLVVGEWGLYAKYKHVLAASNSIANEFGVTFQNNLVYDPQHSAPADDMWASIGEKKKHPMTEGVPFFYYPSGSSMMLKDTGRRMAWASPYAWGEASLWGPDNYFGQQYDEEYPFISMNPKQYILKDKIMQSPLYMKPDAGELKGANLIVMAAFAHGKGKVVFIGDSDVFTQTNPENIQLLINIFRWLSS